MQRRDNVMPMTAAARGPAAAVVVGQPPSRQGAARSGADRAVSSTGRGRELDLMSVHRDRPLQGWRLDAARSHGEIATRHALWGRRASPLRLVDGHLQRNGHRIDELHVAVATVGGAATSLLSMKARPTGSPKGAMLDTTGVIHADDEIIPVTFRVHDLGVARDPLHGERRFATVRVSVAAGGRSGWRGSLWHPFLAGRRIEIFCHLEWLPAARPAQLL